MQVLLVSLATLLAVPSLEGVPTDTLDTRPDWMDRTVLVTGLTVDPADPPPGSGVARAMAFVGDAYVMVVYGQPYRRSREIFGGLVPFGEVWPLGAHFATEIATTEPIRIGGQTLEPGVYSLFGTPDERVWTIHVNTELGMHMTQRYDPANDVLRISVPAEHLPEATEAFTIDFERMGQQVDLRVTWEHTRVRVPLEPVR